MPHFYFHLHDGKSRLKDRRGAWLPDAEAAWYQAFRNAREIVVVARSNQLPCREQALEVEDERGLQVWTMPLAEVAELVG